MYDVIKCKIGGAFLQTFHGVVLPNDKQTSLLQIETTPSVGSDLSFFGDSALLLLAWHLNVAL